MLSRGGARILGNDPAEMGDARADLAYVFAAAGLSVDLSAGDCQRWEAKAQGLSRAAAQDVIDRFGISSYAKRRVSRLSTGQRQRVPLAAALLGDPEVLILEEPHNGLDVEAGRWLRDLIYERNQGGRTTIPRVLGVACRG